MRRENESSNLSEVHGAGPMGMFRLRKVDCRVFGFLVKSHDSLMKAAATSETATMV